MSTDNVRVLHCALPACADGLCAAAPEPARVFRVRLEYVPDSTPPLWSAIQHWRRLAVFNVNDFDGYTHISRRFYQNERGQRIGVNVNQLAASVRADGMVFCPRGALCFIVRAMHRSVGWGREVGPFGPEPTTPSCPCQLANAPNTSCCAPVRAGPCCNCI